MPSHYDDKSYSYESYWQGRDYEHHSEVLAICQLLKTNHFDTAADVGGGFGRLIPILADYANHLTLVEPSKKQRNIAIKFLSSIKSRVDILAGTAQNLPFADNSQDLVTMIRVMHHLPEPSDSLKEIYRVLRPSGFLILEFANSSHFKARLKSIISGQPLLLTPVERRSLINIKKKTIPFVNHNPKTVLKQLAHSGFAVKKILSVSNFRSPFLKSHLPQKLLLNLEEPSQSLLARLYFGPSIFVFAQKY